MLLFLFKRFCSAVAMLAVVSMMTFATFFWLPKLAGVTPAQLAASYTGKNASSETAREVAVRFGFYEPLPVAYGRWVRGLFAGADFDTGNGVVHCAAPCLGFSYRDNVPVWPELLERVPVTASIALGAAVLWLLFGVAAGVLSALRPDRLLDHAVRGVALVGVSLPVYFTGLMSLSVLSYGLGITAPGSDYVPFTQNPLRWAYALLLPWSVLAFQYAATYARVTRATMLETLREDYVRTARAKGLPERAVVCKHALRATLGPTLSLFGLDLGLLLGGAVLTEGTFSLPGLGTYALDAITSDLPRILGATLVASVFVVVSSFVVDVVYALLDPKVRIS